MGAWTVPFQLADGGKIWCFNVPLCYNMAETRTALYGEMPQKQGCQTRKRHPEGRSDITRSEVHAEDHKGQRGTSTKKLEMKQSGGSEHLSQNRGQRRCPPWGSSASLAQVSVNTTRTRVRKRRPRVNVHKAPVRTRVTSGQPKGDPPPKRVHGREHSLPVCVRVCVCLCARD